MLTGKCPNQLRHGGGLRTDWVERKEEGIAAVMCVCVGVLFRVCVYKEQTYT